MKKAHEIERIERERQPTKKAETVYLSDLDGCNFWRVLNENSIFQENRQKLSGKAKTAIFHRDETKNAGDWKRAAGTSPKDWEFKEQQHVLKIQYHKNGEGKAYIYKEEVIKKYEGLIFTDEVIHNQQRKKPPTRSGPIEQNGLTRKAVRSIRIASDCYNLLVTGQLYGEQQSKEIFKYYDSLVRFITLTFRQIIPSDKDAKKLLNTFLQRLRRSKKSRLPEEFKPLEKKYKALKKEINRLKKKDRNPAEDEELKKRKIKFSRLDTKKYKRLKNQSRIHYIWVAERQKGKTIEGRDSYRKKHKQSVLHFHILSPEILIPEEPPEELEDRKNAERIYLNRVWNEIVLDYAVKNRKIDIEAATLWLDEISENERYNFELYAHRNKGGPEPKKPNYMQFRNGTSQQHNRNPKSLYLLTPNLSFVFHAGAYMAKYMSKENAQIVGNMWNMSSRTRELAKPIETKIKADFLTVSHGLNYIELILKENKNKGDKDHFSFEIYPIARKKDTAEGETETFYNIAEKKAAFSNWTIGEETARRTYKSFTSVGDENGTLISRGIWSRRGAQMLEAFARFEMLQNEKEISKILGKHELKVRAKKGLFYGHGLENNFL